VRRRLVPIVVCLLLVAAHQARTRSQARETVTSPLQQFGANIGDDHFLATNTQFEQYRKKVDEESDRVRLVRIGATEEGRAQWMAVVSSPANLANVDRYREISRRLALAEGLTDEQARALAGDGKAIVWIDGGLHADEVLGPQQLIEVLYRLASGTDDETLRILQDTIVLLVHANPDGHALVGDWYMRESNPSRRTLADIPRAYQKYVGHDNNRDFFLSSQAETININRVLYKEWFPQIVYDHHQTAPAGTVMFAPPFRGPFNYVFDPLIPASIDLLGAAMHARFAAEGKRGVTMRTGATYSAWWNGGLRTTAYFHNQIGLLTETIGSPTPTEIPRVSGRQLPSVDLPFPIDPQPWHFRQSIEYSMTANRAVLDAASRYRETLLLNVYRMARNAIEAGSRDSWIASPHRRSADRDPATRAPRGYILPANQPDFLTATKFVDALLKAGVIVHRATAPFSVGRAHYPAGSYVVRSAQAFRAHVIDMFEPQDHPDEFAFPGGPPTPPYDIAGWTLAFQMGVKFDRILDAFDGPFEKVDVASLPRGTIGGPAAPAGYLISHHQNDSAIVVNRLLKAGEQVYWLRDRNAGGTGNGTGAIYVDARPGTAAVLQQAASSTGVSAIGVPSRVAGAALQLRPVRIGLWDQYGGASSSGWLRWIFERYDFPFERVYVQALDAGDLAGRYDVLVLTDEAVPGRSRLPAADLPAEYRATTGALTSERTVPRLKEFVDSGGTLILIGDSSGIAGSLGVPVTNALVERQADGSTQPPGEIVYVPGSILRVAVDNTTPLGYGFESTVDVVFDRSPVFHLPAGDSSVHRVAWFADRTPLRSGWAWGQERLAGGVAIADARVGRGRVLLFGPEIAFRAQSHGTFKFLFNGIHSTKAAPVTLGK
jgi:hypothetical protein